MNTDKFHALINRLKELEKEKDVINARFDELRDRALTPEIKARISEIEANRADQIEEINQKIAEIERQIRTVLIDQIDRDCRQEGKK